MAATEGKSVTIHTEGLEKDGLLGSARLSGSSAPATVRDVERIVATVRDCFAKFIQEQLTYAESSASEQSIEQLTGTAAAATAVAAASSGGRDSAKIEAIDSRTAEIAGTLGSISLGVSSMKPVAEIAKRVEKPLGILEQLAESPNMMFNIVKLSIKEGLKSLLSSPVLIFGLILVGTMIYKFLIKPHIDEFKAWWDIIKAAWDGFYEGLKTTYDELIKPALEACKPYLVEAWEFWKEYGRKVVDFWKNFDLKSEWNNIVGYGKDIWDKVTKQANDMWETLKSIPGKVWTWIKDGVNDGIQWISDRLHDIVDSVQSFFERMFVKMRKALSWVPGLADEEEINAELMTKLNEEGKKLAEEKKALSKMYQEAKTDAEREAAMKKMKRLDERTDKFQEKVKSYELTDKEISEANKLLKKQGKGATDEFNKATEANKVGGKMSSGGKIEVNAGAAQNGIFGEGTQLKAAVTDAKGNKEIQLSAEQNKEFEERIKRVFAKNLENIKKYKEKKGETYDEAEAIKQLGDRVMSGIDMLAKRSDKIAEGQISDSDLKSALSMATRGGAKDKPKTTIVVQGAPKSEPTPPRSMHSSGRGGSSILLR